LSDAVDLIKSVKQWHINWSFHYWARTHRQLLINFNYLCPYIGFIWHYSMDHNYKIETWSPAGTFRTDLAWGKHQCCAWYPLCTTTSYSTKVPL